MRPAAYVALVALLIGLTGCVSIKKVSRDQLPREWTAALPEPASPFRNPDGVYAAAGRLAASGEQTQEAMLSQALFPGRKMGATRYRLAWDATASSLTVTPLDGNFAGRPRTFSVQIAPADGALFIAEVPVRGSSFGPDETKQSVWLRIGRDGALYIEISASFVGVSGIVPYAGHHHLWGRWEKVATAP